MPRAKSVYVIVNADGSWNMLEEDAKLLEITPKGEEQLDRAGKVEDIEPKNIKSTHEVMTLLRFFRTISTHAPLVAFTALKKAHKATLNMSYKEKSK